MTFVAAAPPSTEIRSDPDAQVLADAEDVLVRVLFDDIVRTLLRPATGRIPEPVPAPARRRAQTAPPPETGSVDRRGPAWARSPPWISG